MSRESRKDRDARWARESEEWRRGGLGGGTFVEVGWVARGLRGQFAHNVSLANREAEDWLWRESVDDEPKTVRLFMLIPGDASSSGVSIVGRISTDLESDGG